MSYTPSDELVQTLNTTPKYECNEVRNNNLNTTCVTIVRIRAKTLKYDDALRRQVIT